MSVLVKALHLLELLAEEGPLGLSTLSKQAGITKASAYRILSTLEGHGFLTKAPNDRNYIPDHRLIRLSCAFISRSTLVTTARPVLERLYREFGETVNLAAVNETSAIYLDIIESERELRMAAVVGQRDPLHSTALGKAILASLSVDQAAQLIDRIDWVSRTPNTISSKARMTLELQAIRERGYAIDDEENEPGARCVAAPIPYEHGGSQAAVSISGPCARMDDATVELMGSRLIEATYEIAERAGFTRSESPSKRKYKPRKDRQALQSTAG